MPRSTDVLSIRVSQAERDLLNLAATQARSNLSDYARRKAVEGAELDVLDRRTAHIPLADWERFDVWAERPPQAIPALEALSAQRPLWEE